MNALVVIGALSAVALQVLRETNDVIGRQEVLRDGAQADLVADAGVLLASRLLEEDRARSNVDHAGEAWALSGYHADAGEGSMTIWLEDLQSRFNINLLIAEDTGAPVSTFQGISRFAGIAETEVDAVVSHYLRNAPPPGTSEVGRGGGAQFLPGDIVLLDELSALEGISRAAPARLSEYAVALPRERKINVNTASAKIVASALGVDNSAGVQTLLTGREADPFTDMASFRARVAEALGSVVETRIPEALLGVESAWFEARIDASFGTSFRSYTVLLYRDPGSGAVTKIAQFPGADK